MICDLVAAGCLPARKLVKLFINEHFSINDCSEHQILIKNRTESLEKERMKINYQRAAAYLHRPKSKE